MKFCGSSIVMKAEKPMSASPFYRGKTSVTGYVRR